MTRAMLNPGRALRAMRCTVLAFRQVRFSSNVASTSKGPKSQLPKPRLDYARLLANPELTTRNVVERALPLASDHVDRLRVARSEQLVLENELNSKRAEHGLASGKFRDAEERKESIKRARQLKAEVALIEERFNIADSALLELALSLPNFSHPSVPIGAEENAVIIDSFGPKPLLANQHRDHVRVAETYGWLDSAASAIATGSSWPYLIGVLAQLEHALVGYALSTAVKQGFTPVSTPDVIRSDIAWRCGFQPRDSPDGPQQTYQIDNGQEAPTHCLAGTAEIPLAAMWANRILNSTALPARVVGVGRAFRAEAGARGADTRGLYRVHQFTKVELFCVTGQGEGESENAMEDMRRLQREIAHNLGLSVRVLDMPTEELGASASRKYDMEAWMPGRGKWGEITSTSNCTDYQSRRLHIRYRDAEGLKFAHTLNGTAAAIPRLIVALLENGVRLAEDGRILGVNLPRVLRPWWIGPEAEEEGEGDIIRWL